ncbi:MAG: TIGR03013 family PEP-CTERM/XrtA system glycosyltransferase [candidate division NC10 bacterium]|nr:TIGR03013 family PEP-CTERM/XrtA system glycosyltransferase [candidate division NC10 bacterium]
MLRVFGHYLPARVLFLAFADLILLMGAGYVGMLTPLWLGHGPFPPKVLAFVAFGWAILFVGGTYDFSPPQDRKEIVIHLIGCFAALVVLMSAIGFAFPYLRWGRLALLLSLVLGFLAVTSVRVLTLNLWNTPRFRERLLLLGATPLADRLIEMLSRMGTHGYEVLGYVDDRSETDLCLNNGYRLLGRVSELGRVAIEQRAGTIVVTLDERRGTLPLAPVLDCKLRGLRVEDWPSFYERLTRRIGIENLRPSWLVFSDGFRRTSITRSVKRAVDIVAALLFLAVGFPLFALIALAIRLESRGSIFYRQERVGEAGKIFRLLKFRTMYERAEEGSGPVWATANDPRVTRTGRVLRRTRLDEFPQIVNVLKGDMSFVGPRPERPHFVAMLQARIPYYTQRLSVKPGITGWAQIRYSYGSTVEDAAQKLEYDLYYVKNMSIFLDLLILFHTVQVVLFGRGAR